VQSHSAQAGTTRVGNAAAGAGGLQGNAAAGADQKREEADVDGRHDDVDEQSRHPSDKLQNLSHVHNPQSLARVGR
jgi:hypothetical protein